VAQGDIRTKIRDILGAFMFGGEAADKKVKVLSGGERSRLAMIRLLLEPVNLLILDEPTNHLDMRSKDVLKAALRDFDGTLIVVSHDREFLDGLVTKIYEFGGQRVKEHLGGIYEFLERKKIGSLVELERKTNAVENDAPATQNAKQAYEQQKEQNRIARRLEKDVAETEQIITRLEGEITQTEQQMSTPEGAANAALYTQHQLLKQQLAAAIDRWTEQTMLLENHQSGA
jgi:ATP-binding cassette subfamily F protein 3